MLFAFPLPVWFPWNGFFNTPTAGIIALVIYVFASITDSIDGHIARKYNLVTNFGKFLDPIADKLLVMAAMLSLIPRNLLYLWAAMIILAREFIVTGVRLVSAGEGVVIAAGKGGKLKMVLQTIALITLLTAGLFEGTKGGLELTGTVLQVIGDVTLILAVIMTLISGAEYVKNSWGLLKKDM